MISVTDIFKIATVDEWYQKFIDLSATLKLKTTAWQPGGITRTIYAVMARAFNFSDTLVTQAISSVFLDMSASVTPEGGPGALDLLSQQTYGNTRSPATQGVTTITITNSGGAIGPFPAGSYHVEIPSTKHTYANRDAFTISGGANPGVTLICDSFGLSDVSGATVKAVSTYPGVSLSTLDGDAVGRPVESNASLVARDRAKRASLGPKLGGKKSIEYFAITTTDENGVALPDYPLPLSPITRVKVVVDLVTGALTTIIANSSSAPPSGGDVTAMGSYLDAVAVADGDANTTAAASANGIVFVVSVWCPASYAGQLTADVTKAIADFCSVTPIGGEVTEDSLTGFSLEEFEAFLVRRLTYIRTLNSTLNGVELSVVMAYNEIPNPITITVNRIGA